MQADIVNLLYMSLFSFSFLLFNPTQRHFYCQVTKVIDGDTVIVNGKNRVRLIDIDAPELDQKAFDQSSIGRFSKKVLDELVMNKKIKIILYAKGYYGRWLGRIILGKIDINKFLVKNGAALSFSKFYLYDELMARKNRVGIWKTSGFYTPKAYRKITKRY